MEQTPKIFPVNARGHRPATGRQRFIVVATGTFFALRPNPETIAAEEPPSPLEPCDIRRWNFGRSITCRRSP